MAAPRSFVLSVLGIAMLAAGYGLGLLAGSGAEPKVEIVRILNRPSAPGGTTSPSAPAAPPSQARPGPSPPPVPGSPPGALPPDLRESLRAFLEQVPEPEVPRGTGSITGIVRTEDGIPLDGVEVTCSPVPPAAPVPARRRGDPRGERDPVDAAVLAFRESRFFARPRWRTKTNAAGEFRFDGLSGVRHVVRAAKRGWEMDRVDAEGEDRPGTEVVYKAVPSVEVWFEVAAADGKVLGDVVLRVRGPGFDGTAAFDAEDPTLRLYPGSYEFSAESGEYACEPKTVEVSREGEAPLVRLVLQRPR
jgi:hypothetical protein